MASSARTDKGSGVQRAGRTGGRAGDAAPRLQLAMFAMAAMLILTLLGPAMTFNSNDDSPSTLIRQLGYAAILIVGLISIRPFQRPDRLANIPLPLLAALVWCWISVSWAIDPFVSMRRVILTSMIVWTVFTLVAQLGYVRTLTLIRIALLVTLIANFYWVWAYPREGIHMIDSLDDPSLTGDWRGIMGHKNTAGLVSALAVIFFLFDRRSMPRIVQIPVIAFATLFLALSSSRTSIGVGAAAVVIGLIFQYYRARYRKFAVGLILALAIGGAILQSSYSDPFLRQINDPSTLSGRTLIWEALWQYYRHNPVFGAGYGSFWNIGPESPIYRYASVAWVEDVKQGHNGFLDLLVQIGPIGLALVLCATIVAPLKRLLGSENIEGGRGALIAAAILFCVAHNGSESSLFDRDSIGQVFLMLTLAMLWQQTASGGTRLRTGSDMLAWATRSDRKPVEPKAGARSTRRS